MIRIAIVLLVAISGSAWAMCARAIAARSFFHASPHAAEGVLADAEFGPRYDELLDLAEWVRSGPGRAANALTATWIDTAARDNADRALYLLEEAAYLVAGVAIPILASPEPPVQFFLGNHPVAALDLAAQSTGSSVFPRKTHFPALIGNLAVRPVHLVTNERLAVAHRIASDSKMANDRSSRAYGLARGSGKAAREFERSVQRAIDTILNRTASTKLSSLFRLLHECGATRIWNELGHHRRLATTFHAAADRIYQQCVDKIPTTPERKEGLKKMMRTYSSHYYEGFFPPRYEPLTGADLEAHELGELHMLAVKLMGEFQAEKESRRKQLAAEAEAAKRAKLDAHASDAALREGRLARHLEHLAEREREQAAQLEALPIAAGVREGVASSVVPKPLLEEADLPALVRRRSITAARAEQIIDYYGKLQPSEKTLFLFVLGELFLDPSRRLSAVLHGDVWHLRGRDLLEVRIQGNTMPIRLYFGIKKHDGVYLTGARYKKGGDPEQMVIVDSDNDAWRDFLKP